MGRNRLSAGSIPGALLLLWFAGVGRAAGPDLRQAEDLYQRTDYRAAVDTLLSLSPKNAAVYTLMGQAYYMNGQYKDSISYFEKAVAEDTRNSRYYDWLGKAYGRHAEEASFLTALGYANKTRASFEKAVALDPSNLEALGDLFEFYLEAPGMVGGGVAKAERIAASIGRVNETEYHYVRARLAERRKDSAAAEEELRQAMRLAPGDIGRIIDVAAFLSKQGRYQESDQLFRAAAAIAPESPRLMFARAAAYIQSGRNLQEAKALLRRYGDARITPDDPPRSDAARLLRAARR